MLPNTKNKKNHFKNPLILMGIFLTIITQISLIKSQLSPDNVVFAINCGGDSMSDSKGVFYEKVTKNPLIIGY